MSAFGVDADFESMNRAARHRNGPKTFASTVLVSWTHVCRVFASCRNPACDFLMSAIGVEADVRSGSLNALKRTLSLSEGRDRPLECLQASQVAIPIDRLRELAISRCV